MSQSQLRSAASNDGGDDEINLTDSGAAYRCRSKYVDAALSKEVVQAISEASRMVSRPLLYNMDPAAMEKTQPWVHRPIEWVACRWLDLHNHLPSLILLLPISRARHVGHCHCHCPCRLVSLACCFFERCISASV